ncbi:MAG: adenylate/guanylate cyclase domain-containing protein [Desulfococcus multivorans]|jgi:class 3 adenylate cyclase|nr:adenylate/guanylate cyclase domain-containing protein [Desulfococcus multivorans]
MEYDALKSEFVELLACSFKPEEINEIGKFFDKKYDHHALSGTERHVTVSSRKAALILVEHLGDDKRCGLTRLVQFVVGLDGKLFMNRVTELKGLETFLAGLVRIGRHYDFRSGRIIESQKDLRKLLNWGALRDDKFYDVTIMSIDVVHNSELVRKYGLKVMEKLYFKFQAFLDHLLGHYDGRVWNWAGDGGIIAFTFKGHETRAVLCALDIQRSLMVFQLSGDYPLPENFSVRVALDCGKVKFNSDTGKIVSDVINYAAHLEKAGTEPGKVTISSHVRGALKEKAAALFSVQADFEGQPAFSTAVRLDALAEPSAKPAARRKKAAK